MKILPFALMLVLIGCSPSEDQTTRMSRQIREWVPVGTSLVSARQILEQHQFTCSVDSYTNLEAMMREPLAIQWKPLWTAGSFKNGKIEAVTNISILHCTGTDNGKTYRITMPTSNGEIDGYLSMSAW
jgi:hypothetical protein